MRAVDHMRREVAFQDLLSEPLRNGVYKPKAFHGGGTKVVNTKELFAFERIDDQPERRIELTESELQKFALEPGDLLFARRSFVLEGSGKCTLVGRPSEPTVFESSMIRARPDRNISEPSFLYYFFRAPQGQGLMASISSRTAVSGITGSSLSRLRLPIPPLKVQKAVAGVLRVYDDLIENNTRRIQILEEMARATYREWFADFRFAGHANVQFVESDGGLIPEGWSSVALGSRFSVVLGGTPSRKRPDYWTSGTIPWINSGKVNDLRVVEPSELITEDALRNSSTKLMPRRTTVVAITGATLGQVSYLEIGACANQSVVGIFDPEAECNELIYLAVCHQIDSIIAKASGGAQQHINKSVIEETRVLVPTRAILAQFREMFEPVFDLVAVFTRASLNLQATRDSLLPRLISGEVDVSDLDIDTSGLVS